MLQSSNKMEVIIKGKEKEMGKKKLPAQFDEIIRPDIIKKVVVAQLANKRQPYGAKPEAGKRPSAKVSRRRRDYRGSYGHGISRVPRKVVSRSGTRFNWIGAFAPGTVGGRRAHPPKAEKIWSQKINIKEKRKAIRSAMAAAMNKDLVEKKGHLIPDKYPFIIATDIETIKTAKEARQFLITIGLEKELGRIQEKSIRAGVGKMRGRKYKKVRGILIVVSQKCDALRAFRNIPGVEARVVNTLSVEVLAPGTTPGRLTLFTEESINRVEKEKLFI